MDEREKELKDKRICRFCMTQEEPLTNIHSVENRVNTKVSLPVQILACTSIEVFSNDTMPTTVCSSCRLLMDYCYRFKQNCKTSDTKLKQYPLTGVWPEPLETLKIPNEMLWPSKENRPKRSPVKSPSSQQPNKSTPPTKQIVKREVTNVVVAAEQPRAKQVHNIINKEPKILRVKDDSGEIVYEISETGEPQVKRQKLSDSIKQKISNHYQVPDASTLVVKQEELPLKQQKKQLNTPKILNNSMAKMKKQQQYLSEPIIKTDAMGNVEIFTELIEKNDDEGQDDPMKFAPAVETNVFPCNQCERTFPLKQLLELHMTNHNRERSFQCGVCSKSFYSKYDLGKHVTIHTGEKPYQCVVCKKCFSRSTLLFRHEKVHTDQPKFLCDHCDRAFLSLDELNKHAETHRKFRPFQCDVCPKSFAFKQGLERHKVIHATDQPFPCEYCEKSFMTRGKLARHLTAHAGERPYPCKLCPKSFLLSHHLTRHLRSHSVGDSDVTYKCSDCELVFQARDELIYHSAVHATQNLVCPLCKEQFDELDDVTEHIKLHATGEQYPCDYCDLIFPVLEKLEIHCLDEHREDHRGNEHVNINDDNQNKSNSMEEDDEEITDIVSHNGNVLEEIVAPKSKIYGYGRNSKKAPKILNKLEHIEDLKDDNVEVLAEFEIRRSARPNIQKNYARMIKTEISEGEDNQDGEDEDKGDELIETGDDLDDENYDPSIEEHVMEETTVINRQKKTSTQEKITKFLQYSGKSSQTKPTEKPTGNEEKKKPVKSTDIQKVLNNLPRSVTVFKKENKETETKPTEDHEKSPRILNTKVVENKTPPIKAVSVQKSIDKDIKMNINPAKGGPLKASPNTSASKPQTKSIAQISNSRNQSASSNSSISPLKVNPQIEMKSVKTQPLATSTPQQSSESNSKYCEMKIGDRMVKVQKVRMTKTQVDAMKKEGKIEMKDGAIILKNCASSKISDGRIISKVVKKSPGAGPSAATKSNPDKPQAKAK